MKRQRGIYRGFLFAVPLWRNLIQFRFKKRAVIHVLGMNYIER